MVHAEISGSLRIWEMRNLSFRQRMDWLRAEKEVRPVRQLRGSMGRRRTGGGLEGKEG